MESREELGECEGLGDIVVAARLEAVHTIVDAAERCQKQHRYLLADAAQSPYEIEPIDAREHAVDDDDVIVLGAVA